MFEDRIKTDARLPYIDVTDEEAEIYHGCGDAIAYVDGGRFTSFVYLGDLAEDGAKAAAADALKHGNAWLGMLSCHQFCKPEKLDASNPALFARVIRLVAEKWESPDSLP